MDSSNQFNLRITLLWLCLGIYLFICLGVGLIVFSAITKGQDWGVSALVSTVETQSSVFFIPINSAIYGWVSYASVKENLPTVYPKATLWIIVFSVICGIAFWLESLALQDKRFISSFDKVEESQVQSTINLLQTLTMALFSYPAVLLGLPKSSNQ